MKELIKHIIPFKILIIVTLLSQPAFSKTEYSELLETFKMNDVRPLHLEEVHLDSKNSNLIQLGELLFFDKILSGNKNISCATCHFPTMGTSDQLPVPIGTGGEGLGKDRKLAKGHFIPRNAPTAFNMGFANFHTTMWDGRISVKWNEGKNKLMLNTPESLINGDSPDASSIQLVKQITNVAAAQALFPVTSHHEMRGQVGENEIADAETNFQVWERLTERIVGKKNGTSGGIQKYRSLIKLAYPEIKNFDDINFGHLARAIASYEMFAFQADNSPFDEFLSGNKGALTHKQYKGAKLFAGKGKCLSCHSGSLLTNFKSYSIGVPQLGPGKNPIEGEVFGEDFGMELITGKIEDRYKFKTPSLRNVYYSGPWSHSGVFADLKVFLKHHVDPEIGMDKFLLNPKSYVSDQLAENFLNYLDLSISRNWARVISQDPILTEVTLTKNEINEVYLFLKSLTDLSVYTRAKIPKAVPSGLPLD